MVYYLKANKTKMVKLLRDKGYKPTIKKAQYEKAFRARSFWLTWLESDGMYQALLMTAGGRTYLRVRNLTTDDEKMVHIPLAVLKQLDMAEPAGEPCDQ